MKKIIFGTLLIAVITILGAIYIFDNYGEIDNKKEENKPKEETKEEKEVDAYTDDNPIKIGIYMDDYVGLKLITEQTTTWREKLDLGVYWVYATTENTINGDTYQNMWKKYWQNYPVNEQYKIGYNLKFALEDGTVINQNLLEPVDDTVPIFKKVMYFLYDDINVTPGTFYSHVEPGQVTDKTIFSSIKLTGSSETNKIISPIELTAFTYNGSDDFDPETGNYRGSSSYTIKIYKK